MPEDGSRPPNIIGMPEMVAVRRRADLCKKNRSSSSMRYTDKNALDDVHRPDFKTARCVSRAVRTPPSWGRNTPSAK